MSQFDVALVAYAPNGARLGPLPVPSRITSAANPLNDMPMLQLDYLESAPGFDLLGSPVEIAVEVYNPSTGTWTEPFNSRYLLIDWDANTASNTGRHTYNCPGYAYNLDKVVTRPRSKADISEDISQAQLAAANARAAYQSACATLRTAVGAGPKAGVIFASYSPTVVNGGIFVNYDENPYQVFLGKKSKGKDGSWVAKTGPTIVNAAVNAYEKKLVYDDANAGITRAKNDKSFDREIQAATPGKVMNQLLSEAQARGNRLPGLTWDFSANSDSNGQPWATLFEEPLVIKAGQSALGVLQNLTDQGMCDWVMEGRELHIYNPDTALLRDRTNVQLLVGTDIKDAPDKGTYGSLTHNILFLGEEGTTFELTNNAPISPWGRWEKSVSQGGVTSRSVGTRLGQAQLDAGAAPRTESTRDLVYRPGRPLPYLDYRVGDTISSIGGTGVSETMRVRQITLTREPDGTAGGNLILGDRFLEAEVRSRRQMDGILNGTTPRGDGTIPGTPVIPSERRPESPRDLRAVAQNYRGPNGKTVGRILVDWEWDGIDTNGTLIEGDGYQVQFRPDDLSAPWASARIVWLTEMNLDDVPIRDDGGNVAVYEVRVRAIAYNGRTSDWSDVATVMMEADVTPPPVPSTPIGQAVYGAVSIQWDGLGAGGETMPIDFLHVEAEIASTPEGEWFLAGTMDGATSIFVPFALEYGNYWLRLRSVDRSGNKSEWSALGTVTTTPLVELPDVHDLIQDIDTQIQGVRQSANGANTRTDSVEDPTVKGGEKPGDSWFKWVEGAHVSDPKILIGQWTWMGGRWEAVEMGHQVLASIDLGRATVGFLDGIHIKAGSINAGALIVGDFTNLATLNPDLKINTTIPEDNLTETVGNRARKAAGGNDRLAFMNPLPGVPVEAGDWVRISFNASTTSGASVTPKVWIFSGTNGTGSVVEGSGIALDLTPGGREYSVDVKIPTLASVGGGLSWYAGLDGPGVRQVSIRTVRVYKKMNATLIGPDSIDTPHLRAGAVDTLHLKANAVEADKLAFGFADGQVITGALMQSVAAANRGFKIDGLSNRFYAWSNTGDKVFDLNGDNGNIVLGKGGTFRVDGATGSLDIGNGKMTVNGSTGAIVVSNASITGASLVGGYWRMNGSGAGVGYDVMVGIDGYGMSYLAFSAPNSDTSATIRPHQQGAEAGSIGDDYDSGPDLPNGGMELVLRSPRNTGVTTDRMVLWMQSHEGNNGAFDQPRAAFRGDVYLSGAGSYYGSGNVIVDSGSNSILDLGVHSNGVRSTVVRDRPYTGAANVYVTENGYIGQTSSASRFKLDQQIMHPSDELLEIPVKDWIDKTSSGEVDDLYDLGVLTEEQQSLVDSGYGRKRTPGVVAEDVAAVEGGEMFVTYNADGEIQGVAYDRLAIAQIAVLTRQIREIQSKM